MEEIRTMVRYLSSHPLIGVGVAIFLVGIYYLLTRKSALQRDADARLRQLREERGDYYRNLRPPR